MIKKKIIQVISVITAILTCFGAPVSALNRSDANKFSANNILFYDPDAKTCSTGTLSGSTLSEKVLSYLLSIGLNDTAAAGVYGNMMREGLGSASLLEHENGTDDISDVGTYYAAAGLHVKESDVRDLDDPDVMHGLGFIQWSFERRVNLLNALKEAGVDQYAREWNGSRYTYDGMSYEELANTIGQGEADKILMTELQFFYDEHQEYKVTQDDIDAQNLSQYGITSGMGILEALNLVSSTDEATILFFTTSEMPSFTSLPESVGGSERKKYAADGYELIRSAGISSAGRTICGAGNGGDMIATKAVSLAWPNTDGTCVHDGQRVQWANDPSICYDDIKPEYKEAMIAAGGTNGGNYCANYGHTNQGELDYYQDCGHFVATVVSAAGVDPDFPREGTSAMKDYMVSSDKWSEIDNLKSTDNLKPGDIFVVNAGTGEASSGHIMIYTGELSSYGNLASASLCGRTSNMGQVFFEDNRGKYRIFRSNYSSNSTDQPIYPLDEDSSDIPCDSRTIDLGVRKDAYRNGVQMNIRVCAIPTILSNNSEVDGANGYAVVNSRVSGAFYALGQKMIDDGRTSAERTVTSSYRTYATQQALYNSGNGGYSVAKPGYSLHQSGLAVDFGATTSDWSSNLSVYLGNTIENFGLGRPVSDEPWHVQPQ